MPGRMRPLRGGGRRYGHAEGLAHAVVQRDIDGRDGAGEDPPAFKVLAAVPGEDRRHHGKS